MVSEEQLQERQSGNSNNHSDEYRSAYFIDNCRVTHSFGFRRLQGKTQILGPGQGDYHRTRMTHSLEVASICRSILDYLLSRYSDTVEEGIFLRKIDHQHYYSLLTTIGCLHDIGHPPFGHAGETALNFKMHKNGGFEGNAQTLRLLTKLEPFKSELGLDLTRRTLLGVLKYPAIFSSFKMKSQKKLPTKNRHIIIDKWHPPKCYYDDDKELFKWIIDCFSNEDKKLFSTKNKKKKAQYKSFDCTIMDLADDISNSVHDLEDAISLHLIKEADLNKCLSKEGLSGLPFNPKDLFSNYAARKTVMGNIIHWIVTSIKIEKHASFEEQILSYHLTIEDQQNLLINSLKELIYDNVIASQEIQTTTYGGMIAVMQLYDAISTNYKELLPSLFTEHIEKNISSIERATCDYIAGMTDDHAIKLHKRLYGSTPGSTFDKI